MDKSTVLKMINDDIGGFEKEKSKISEFLEGSRTEFKAYMDDLLSQMTTALPLLAKTPKVVKKKAKRIKAIPENDDIENDSSLFNTRVTRSSRANTVLDISDILQGTSKRSALIKAQNIIRKQVSDDETDLPLVNKSNGSRPKRVKELLQSSDEEGRRPSKISKLATKTLSKNKNKDKTHDVINDSMQDTVQDANETLTSNGQNQKRTSVKRKLEQHDEDVNTMLSSDEKSVLTEEPVAKKANHSRKSQKIDKFMNQLERISEKSASSKQSEVLSKRSTRSSASVINAQGPSKFIKANIINETMDMSNADEMAASMYFDPISNGPIMHSTMNQNTIVTLEKMTNAKIIIEPLTTKNIFNETVTIKKKKNSFKEPLSHSTIKESEEYNANTTRTIVHKAPKNTNNITVNYGKTSAKTKLDSKLDKFDELITDDESSPESKRYRLQKQKLLNQQKRVTRSNTSTMSEEEEIFKTPLKIKQKNKDLKANTLKNNYKPSALFSPYAKDSVKKRVEAFEQVASPKTNENETGGRVTRTKTRALAAASFVEAPPLTVAQKLARKSLAKAKKISLAKQAKEDCETKEHENTLKSKHSKATRSLEKSAQKSQLKTTPLGKRTLQMPGSISKNQYATPTNTQNLNAYSKPMTGWRGNIVTNTDSFIQPIKSAQKTIDRAAEEKRKRAHEEDARRKREELLKAQAEEKRRKREEKELKNKLAREAKEKIEQEKRLKAEREREEKAKLAQQMQEKQKEEMEKRRIAQLQRAQEKEERRKQEEQLRLQRFQEQEEQYRLLADQTRREHEQEKRKLLPEAKLKNQAMMQAKAKALAQKMMPINYKIDSDPDEEESDDERKPKHQIPPWASRDGRRTQLKIQQNIPMKIITEFFDATKCTPDLRELFTGIDPKKLKRSSSAIWKTPPRYSMMNSVLED